MTATGTAIAVTRYLACRAEVWEHTDQSHLLGETSDILSLTLGSAGVFFLCSEIRKMVL